MVVAGAVLGPDLAAAFTFYPPYLPDPIAANETIIQVELRLYLASNETDSQVRLVPTSDTIDFTPSEVVFSSTGPVALSVTMVARKEGISTIDFIAQVENVANEVTRMVQNATSIATHDINVLAPPLAYSVDDPRWHGVILLNDSFDSGNFSVDSSPLWGRINFGYPSTACGAFDGGMALYFTALGDRQATTKPLSLLGFDGKIHFRQLYGYRSGQDYDSTGDNRVSCENVDPGEEVVFNYLPANQAESNTSAWLPLEELPLGSSAGSFVEYSIALPVAAMHSSARFRWFQKTHSSFPVDPVSGLSLATILAGENDNTSVNGGLGITERELWRFRNLFDQWALDNVRLEVRLNPPIFQILDSDSTRTAFVSTPSGGVNVSVGYADVLVDSPVSNTWTEFAVGDGAHDFPTCGPASIGNANSAQTIRLDQSGYIHAIACLDVYGDASTIVSSFPTRSPRILVMARAPSILTTLDSTTDVDTWTVEFGCDGCAFIRYTTFSSSGVETATASNALSEDLVARVGPSCSFGTLIDSTAGSIQINANSRVFAVACGNALLPSEITQSDKLVVAPRAPTFEFTYTPTTITNAFNVTILPPSDQGFGIAFTVGETHAVDPMCPGPELVISGQVTTTVRASDVVRAVSCCAHANCVDSDVAVWGPIEVRAVAPIYTMECSHMKPLTMAVQVSPTTLDAWVQYQVGEPSAPLDCSETARSPFLYDGKIEVAINSTSLFVVSCLHGLGPSAQVEIPVVVEQCCAGIDSFRYPSCAHVLLLHDDFTTCLDTSKWAKVTTQWGGHDVNGGVHADNIHCVIDQVRAKSVLQLTAHGDLFEGTAPVGSKWADDSGALELRTIDDRFLEWALDGMSPTPCNQFDRCPARRVGAAVQTAAVEQNAGVMVIRLKPCEIFGTLTQVWWGDYTAREYEAQQEVPFLPLWKAGMYQAKTTPEVSFVGSSPSLLAEDTSDDFIELAMQWNATRGRSNLYVNGKLVHKQTLANNSAFLSSQDEPLSLGVWFPNAVAGEPLFSTCDVVVDEVHIFKAEITGDRWCDYEDVNQNVIPCRADADCDDWVYHNCFMPIHEATCVAHRAEAVKQSRADEETDQVIGIDDAEEGSDSEGEDNAGQPTQFFCQFRLQPTIIQADPASVLSSSTEMTQRFIDLQWPTEEGHRDPTPEDGSTPDAD